MQIQYLQIICYMQIQYMQIICYMQILYLQIICYMIIQYPSPSDIFSKYRRNVIPKIFMLGSKT